MNEKLEKLNRELAKGEARLRRAQHEQKILEHQMKQLTLKCYNKVVTEVANKI